MSEKLQFRVTCKFAQIKTNTYNFEILFQNKYSTCLLEVIKEDFSDQDIYLISALGSSTLHNGEVRNPRLHRCSFLLGDQF